MNEYLLTRKNALQLFPVPHVVLLIASSSTATAVGKRGEEQKETNKFKSFLD